MASSLDVSEHKPEILDTLIPSWLPSAVAVMCDGCGLSGVG